MNTKKLESKQKKVMFTYCPHPVTIDKSKEWGDGNIQDFPDGVFLKHESNDPMKITHGVQPNDNGDAPVGWLRDEFGTFEKKPIFVGEGLSVGEKVSLQTLDGLINYDVKTPSVICYNENADGTPNMNDAYIQSMKNLNENYYV